MKKILQCIMVISFVLLIVGCSKDTPSIENIDEDTLQTTYLQTPVKGRPKSQDPLDNIFIALNILKDASYYQSFSTGKIVAKKAITLTTQSLETNRTITPSATFNETKTYSTFVKIAEQIYETKDTIIKREASKVSSDSVSWQNNASNLTHDQYLKNYGYFPSTPSRFVINEKTIISDIEIVTNGIGRKYTYKFYLDPQIATYYYKINVKNIADADSYPTFEKIEMTMTFDYKWRMTRIETYEEYSISVSGLGTVNCEASITETFKNINKSVSIEQESFFKKYL